MPRPRRYPHLTHSRYAPLTWTDRPYTPRRLWRDGTSPFTTQEIGRWIRETSPERRKNALLLPQLNGRNDAVTITHVIDGLMNTEPDQYINAGNLTAHLKERFINIAWNPVTVGWILADLERLQSNDPDRFGVRRIEKLQYGGARQYVLRPDLDTWQWLGRLRRHFAALAEADIDAARASAEMPARGDDIWTGVAA